MDNLIAAMAKIAYEKGTYCVEYKVAEERWLVTLALAPTRRPPPDMMVRRNGIVLVLQHAIGFDYKYVTPDEFDIDQFCIALETPLERVQREIRITHTINMELELIELISNQPGDPDEEDTYI